MSPTGKEWIFGGAKAIAAMVLLPLRWWMPVASALNHEIFSYLCTQECNEHHCVSEKGKTVGILLQSRELLSRLYSPGREAVWSPNGDAQCGAA
ncbi:hypothetical protein EJ903_25220 [Azospirillum griseum]|uniref:Uncharacterized protein n=1 Tax=Azospirillum griseum TaxID=2496639 RepID=A0A431V9Y7_9PROT|nr:hypothetical protein EJ903_25220 [Azospirillum griseum]